MDEKRTHLKAALRELTAEESADIGPHAGLKRLIAYRRRTLPPAEREALQEHLSLCPRCAGLLLELRDFEAASTRDEAPGPESLQQEAWESLVRHLPWKVSAIRSIAGDGRRDVPRPRRLRYFVYGAAAALLLLAVGLAMMTSRRASVSPRDSAPRTAAVLERERDLQKRLEEKEAELAAARKRIQGLEKLETRVAELTSTLAELRRSRPAPERRDQIADASREIEVAVAPRFELRGQEAPGSGFLQGGGAVNPVRMEAGRFTVALSLADHPVHGEYRLALVDRDGKTLWTGRRPSRSLLGDAGTTVSVSRLSPGLYRLRIEGLQQGSRELLAEYILEVV